MVLVFLDRLAGLKGIGLYVEGDWKAGWTTGCMGIDPYYLTYRAEQFGYHSQIILAGRRINDDMGKFIAEQTVKQLIAADKPIRSARIGVLGMTFKEDCPDARNSKVNDIIVELKEYGISPLVCDPVADKDDVKKFYGIDLVDMSELKDLDCLIIAVAHKEFKALSRDELLGMLRHDGSRGVVVDVKGIRTRKEFEEAGCSYWRL